MISKSYNQLEKDLDIAVKALEVKESLVNTLRDKADKLVIENEVLKELVEGLEMDQEAITILNASNRSLKAELADLKALCIHQESRLNRAGD